jgi:hypothetical protein
MTVDSKDLGPTLDYRQSKTIKFYYATAAISLSNNAMTSALPFVLAFVVFSVF